MCVLGGVPQAYQIMMTRTKKAQQLYGDRLHKPLDELFRDFIADGARKLRSLLEHGDFFMR